MAKHARSPGGDATAAFVSWLVTGAVGPALAALPVNLVADKLAVSAYRSTCNARYRQTCRGNRTCPVIEGPPQQVHMDRRARRTLTQEVTVAGRLAQPSL